MNRDDQQNEASSAPQENSHNSGAGDTVHKMAINPNPRANENIDETSFDKKEGESSENVGSEITDGEAG